MRVFFVCPTPAVSGATRTMTDLMQGLRQAGIHCLVGITGHGKGPLAASLRACGFELVPVKAKNWLTRKPVSPVKARWRLYRNMAHAARAARDLRDKGIDLVHTDTLLSPMGGFLARRLRLPNVWHMHESVKVEYGQRFTVGSSVAARVINRTADLVPCVSRFTGEKTSAYCALDKIRVVYNGPLSIEAPPAPLSERRAVGQDDEVRILLDGRWPSAKGKRMPFAPWSRSPDEESERN